MMKQICAFCSSKDMKITRPRLYRYRLSGLDNIYLRGGVIQWECRGCGEGYTQIEGEHGLMQLLAVGVLLKPAMLTGREMRFLRTACHLSQSDLAARLGVTRRAILEREKKPRPGLKADQELGLRAIFMKLFLDQLERDGSHLHPGHLGRLKEAVQGFIGLAEGFAVQGKKRKTTLTRNASKEHWDFSDPELLAA